MKHNFRFLLLFLAFIAVSVAGAKDVRQRLTFDFDWQFHLGDEPLIAQADFRPQSWQYEQVQLPHDWSISLPFDRSVGHSSGYLPGGIGWYRKEFRAPLSWRGKRVSIVFDGIYHKATIFLNGRQIAYHRYGYTSFEVDLTPYLNLGSANVLSVRVDHSEKSRWYTGSGIYRHAWLQVVNPVHVATWGTYITTPTVTATGATVSCATTIYNTTEQAANVEVAQLLVDSNGRQIGRGYAARGSVAVEAGKSAELRQQFTVANPHLWSVESPYQYRLLTVVLKGGREVDRYSTRFGIRTVEFRPDSGFFLNHKNIKLQGVCLHQDAGCLGVAMPDRAIERKLSILKDAGVNAIRCSHNPPAPEFLDCCDSLGLLVIDEAFDKWRSGYYEQFFDSCWQQDIGDMVVRDRNHPSVILWSIGNELAEAKLTTSEGVDRARMLQDFVHQMEPTRKVMLALQPGYQQKFAAVTDVVGYNYGEMSLIEDRKHHPERIGLISEAYQYYSGLRPYESRDYDDRNPWNMVSSNPFICGEFIWAGADYIGESMGWPSKGWAACPFDMCMNERPLAAYFRSVWTSRPVLGMGVVDYSLDIDPGKDHWQAPPMVHDWTLPYTDERVLPIHTPSNCDSVVLIDPRGKLYGPRSPRDYINNTIVWNQPYRPGKVVAIGFIGGKEVCRDSIMTSQSKAARFTLSADRTTLKADGQDLSFVDLQLLDQNGVPIRVDDRTVTASVSGSGRLMGINSGEMRRELPFTSPTLPTYFGRCQIVVQSGRSKGTVSLNVSVEGLGSQQFDIAVK